MKFPWSKGTAAHDRWAPDKLPGGDDPHRWESTGPDDPSATEADGPRPPFIIIKFVRVYLGPNPNPPKQPTHAELITGSFRYFKRTYYHGVTAQQAAEHDRVGWIGATKDEYCRASTVVARYGGIQIQPSTGDNVGDGAWRYVYSSVHGPKRTEQYKADQMDLINEADFHASEISWGAALPEGKGASWMRLKTSIDVDNALFFLKLKSTQTQPGSIEIWTEPTPPSNIKLQFLNAISIAAQGTLSAADGFWRVPVKREWYIRRFISTNAPAPGNTTNAPAATDTKTWRFEAVFLQEPKNTRTNLALLPQPDAIPPSDAPTAIKGTVEIGKCRNEP